MSPHTELEQKVRRAEKPSAVEDVIQISITDLEMIEQPIEEPISIKPSKDDELRETVKEIYNALCEKGYDPARQIAGYILSEDPVYITNWKNARGLMARVNRDELLVEIIKTYLKNLEK